MEPVHVTEAELARDLGSLLDRVQSGVEVVIERDAKPIAVLRAFRPRHRRLSEIAACLPADSTATLDADFAADMQDIIESRQRESVHAPKSD